MSQNIEQSPNNDVLLENNTDVKIPLKYQVLLHNDDYTPMDFVVHILQKFFDKDVETATKIMLSIHNSGMGLCGIYSKEIAETKVFQVLRFSKNNKHPLKCTMEQI